MHLNTNTKAILWSGVEKLGSFAANFILQIILARLLMPDDFAVLTMLAIFVYISQVFIDGGFATVLIQKQDCTDDDYNTVFTFNVLVALVAYGLFYMCAPYIERFYDFHGLIQVIRIYFLTLIINSFAMINRLLLIKKLNFSVLAYINTIAVIIAAVPTVILAYSGYNYWALVCQNLVSTLVMAIGNIWASRWTPKIRFSVTSMKSLLPFGVRVFAVDMFYSIYNNLYSLLIGKRYVPADLGYYDRAKTLGSIGPIGFSDFFMRALYPIQSKSNSDAELEVSYNRAFELCVLLIVPLSVFVGVFSEETIGLLYGPNWIPSSGFATLMCLGFMLYPLHSLNVNMLKVRARGDFLLRSEIIKKLIGITLALCLIRFDMQILLIGWLASVYLDFIISEIYVSKTYPFSLGKTIKSFFLTVALSSVLAIAIKIGISQLELNGTFEFLISGIVYSVLYFVIFRHRFKDVLHTRS